MRPQETEMVESFAARLVLREELEKSLTLAPRKTPGAEGRLLKIKVNFFGVCSFIRSFNFQ